MLAVLGLLGAASLGRGFSNALQEDRSDDFQWSPARQVLERENPYAGFLADPDRERLVTAETNNALPDYPITSYAFLLPYAALDWPRAKLAWALTNLACLAAIGFGLVRLNTEPGNPRALAWTLAALFLLWLSTAARDQIAAGQHTVFSLCCLLWAWILGREGNSRLARRIAPLLLAASWLKFTVTVPLSLAFLIHRRWREPAIALGIHGVLLAIACFWTRTGPVTLVADYVAATRTILFEAGIHSDVWDTMAIAGALAPEKGWVRAVLSLAFLAGAGWVAFRRRTTDPEGERETLALLAIPACLAGFHLRYDFIVLVLPLAWVLTRPVPPSIRYPVLAVIAANWWGARILERVFYHPIDSVAGTWDLPGQVGMGMLAAGTWLVFTWMLARFASRPPTVVVPVPHHGAPSSLDDPAERNRDSSPSYAENLR